MRLLVTILFLTTSAALAALVPPKPPTPLNPRIVNLLSEGELTWFYAVTAQDRDGLESDFSNEVSYTGDATLVTLAWDRPACTNVITCYWVYCGTVSGQYTNKVSAGTNLTITLSGLKLPMTNMVVSVSAWRGATPTGPWVRVTNWWPIYATNPVVTQFYKLSVTRTNF